MLRVGCGVPVITFTITSVVINRGSVVEKFPISACVYATWIPEQKNKNLHKQAWIAIVYRFLRVVYTKTRKPVASPEKSDMQ